MPLTNTTIEDKSIKAEQLSFDIGILGPSTSGSIASGIGGVPGATGPQGPQGTQGIQGIQGVQGAVGPQGDVGPQGATGSQGATGAQGPQGADGSAFTFPSGSQGRVVYVKGDLTATQKQGFEFDETTSKFTVDSRYSSSSYVASFSNGAQGVKNAEAAPVLEIEAADELGGSPANNHGFSVDYNGLKEFGVPATFAKTVIGFDGTTLNRSQFGVYVYDFSTTKTSTFFIHPRYDKRLVYHTGSTGLSTIKTVELLTNNVTTAPTDSFGGKVTYALQTAGASTTTTAAVSHEYLWRSLANGQGQYILEIRDSSLGGASNDYNAIESTSRNTKVIGWTASTNTATNALTVESNMATTGTPAANSGVNVTLTARSSTTASRELGALEGFWSTATDASRAGTLRLRATDSSSSAGIELLKDNTGVGSGRTGVRLTPYDSVTGTNTSLIIVPKGTGSIIGGTSVASSSARGNNAIDISLQRGTTSHIAAGNYTTIIGGKNNSTNSSSQYTSIIGSGDTTSGATNFGGIALGTDTGTLGDGYFNAIVGGGSNTVNASYAVALGGQFNYAGEGNSVAMGKKAKAFIPNSFNMASGEYTSSSYDSQSMQFVLRNTTNGSTTVDLLMDGSSIVQPDVSQWTLQALVTGRGASLGSNYSYRLTVSHTRETGTTGTLRAAITDLIYESHAAANVTAISTNGQPRIQVTGVAGIFIKWVAHVTVSQIIY